MVVTVDKIDVVKKRYKKLLPWIPEINVDLYLIVKCQ